MESKTTITITREDIIAYLNANGYDVPETAAFYTKDYDCDSPVTFPLYVDVPAHVAPRAGMEPEPFSLIYSIDAHIPRYVGVKVARNMYGPTPNRIEAIKNIRACTGWPLKLAKEWLDHHFA